MPNFISEDDIELALLQRLQHVHGFDTLDCYTADPEELNDESGRDDKRKVIFEDRLAEAAYRLNAHIPQKEIDRVLPQVLDMRKAMSLITANREVYGLIRDGIRIAELTTRIVLTVSVPHTKLEQFFQRPESQQIGIYFLFGGRDDDTKPIAYAGQTKGLKKRLKYNDSNKEFLTTAGVLISRTLRTPETLEVIDFSKRMMQQLQQYA